MPSPYLQAGGKTLFPTPCTVRTALTCYIDIHGMPRKQLLSYFSVLAAKTEEVCAKTDAGAIVHLL